MAHIFGIRHLSPASSLHLCAYLEQKHPAYILIEGPSDCNDMIEDITQDQLQPPFAIMAYTTSSPIHSILYPYAKYSPEYVAMKWAKAHNIPCAFMDLPTSAFLSLDTKDDTRQDYEIDLDMDANDQWERIFEHETNSDAFQKAVTFFAHNLREIKPADEFTLLRESYMNTTIQKLIKQGIHEDDIVVVCGAFHIEGIMEAKVLPDAQYEKLQKDMQMYVIGKDKDLQHFNG